MNITQFLLTDCDAKARAKGMHLFEASSDLERSCAARATCRKGRDAFRDERLDLGLLKSQVICIDLLRWTWGSLLDRMECPAWSSKYGQRICLVCRTK